MRHRLASDILCEPITAFLPPISSVITIQTPQKKKTHNSKIVAARGADHNRTKFDQSYIPNTRAFGVIRVDIIFFCIIHMKWHSRDYNI